MRRSKLRATAISWNAPCETHPDSYTTVSGTLRLTCSLKCERAAKNIRVYPRNGARFDEFPPSRPPPLYADRYTGVYWAGTGKGTVWTAKIRRRAGRGEATIGSYSSEKVRRKTPKSIFIPYNTHASAPLAMIYRACFLHSEGRHTQRKLLFLEKSRRDISHTRISRRLRCRSCRNKQLRKSSEG